jgi:hypothetical protein
MPITKKSLKRLQFHVDSWESTQSLSFALKLNRPNIVYSHVRTKKITFFFLLVVLYPPSQPSPPNVHFKLVLFYL